jgi:hypothetical protein
MKVLAMCRPKPPISKNIRIKRNAIDLLYVSSAILGLAVTYDAYFGSGLSKDEEIHQEIQIMRELNKNDKEMLEIIRRLDSKIQTNSRAISSLASQHYCDKADICH